MIVVRRPLTTDAAGLALAWEDARRFYSELDSRVFLPPDPEDGQLGDVIVQQLMTSEQLSSRCNRVADKGGTAVGFITATLYEPEENARRAIIRDSTRRHVKIDTLVVQRRHWRGGVGRALVESVEDWARQERASLLKVATHARSPAVDFYDALGYGQRSIVFEKFLDR